MSQNVSMAFRGWPIEAVEFYEGPRKAKDRVVTTLRAGAPLREWLARHVG